MRPDIKGDERKVYSHRPRLLSEYKSSPPLPHGERERDSQSQCVSREGTKSNRRVVRFSYTYFFFLLLLCAFDGSSDLSTPFFPLLLFPLLCVECVKEVGRHRKLIGYFFLSDIFFFISSSSRILNWSLKSSPFLCVYISIGTTVGEFPSLLVWYNNCIIIITQTVHRSSIQSSSLIKDD